MPNRKEIFLNGMENLKQFGNKDQFCLTSSLRIFLFYTYLLLLAKPQKVEKNVFFISGETESNKKDPTQGAYQRLYIRRFSGDAKKLRSARSLAAALSRKDRLSVWFCSLFTRPIGGFYLGRWLEYLLLCRLMDRGKIRSAASFGHYDEFTYWLTSLCREKKISYTMYQHGIVLDHVTVPHRIPCDELHAYNRYFANIFKEKILDSPACRIVTDGLPCSVEFERLSKKGNTKYIGIIDQNDRAWTERIASVVEKIEGAVAVVMLHPLCRGKYFSETRPAILETRKKYDNLDCLIVDFSTLALDYIAHGFSAPIFCTNREASKGVFGEYAVSYIDPENIDVQLLRILKERVL